MASITGVRVNGAQVTGTQVGDTYTLDEPVGPGDVVRIEIANATRFEVLGLPDAGVEPGGGDSIIVTFEIAARAEYSGLPLVRREDGTVLSISLTGGGNQPPTVTAHLPARVGKVGEVIPLRLFDPEGPEDIEEVHINQVYRPQMSEPTEPEPRYSDRLITNDELTIRLDPKSPTLDRWLLVADHPGRYLLNVRIRDRHGNETEEQVAVEALPAHTLGLRGIGTGVTLPDTSYLTDYLSTIRLQLNANLVQLGIGGFAPTLTSSELHECSFVWTPESPCNTPPPDDIVTIIEAAHSWNVQVMLKMNVVFGDYLPFWEQDTDWDAWFSLAPNDPSYANWVLEWAEFAEDHQVEHFVIGNELVKTHVATDGWTDLIAAVREVYSGQITYADNYWVFFNNGTDVPFPACHLLDYQGLNFYFRGSGGEVGGPAENNPSSATMRTNLRSQVEEMFLPAVEQCDYKPVVLTELTMANYDGANRHPEDTAGFDRVRDDIEQAEFIGAALEVMRSYTWFLGAVAWTYELGPEPWSVSNNDIHVDIRDKPAQDTVGIHFSRRIINR